MVLREGGKGKREEREEIAGEREHRQTRPRQAQKDSSNYVVISSALPPSLPPSLLSSYLMMSMRSRRSTGTP